MEHTIDITLRVKVAHELPFMMDENSVKCYINEAMAFMADNTETISCFGDKFEESPQALCVEITELREDNIPQDMDKYGTPDVPLGRDKD